MQLDLRTNKDFWAGAMLAGSGLLAMLIARNYAFGTTLRMGPGYFPSVLGGLLILAGLYTMAMSLKRHETMTTNWSLRALIVLPLSMVVFGLLMEHTGFVPALVALIFGASLAGKEFKFFEVLALSIGLSIFCVILFIWGIGLPYPLFSGW